MTRNVLFLAPTGLDIYKDVIHGLEVAQYKVDFISSSAIPGNPFKPFGGIQRSEEEVSIFLKEVEEFWAKKLEEPKFNKSYDIFFTIDGLMVCDSLFKSLRMRNKDVVFKLYLYDKIDFACKVDRFFKYYDDIFSFDLGDCEQYNLKHLPIYWVPHKSNFDKKYDVFGMASYSSHKKDRPALFRYIRSISKELKLRTYIKLYAPMEPHPFVFYIKNILKRLLNHPTYLPFRDIFSGLVTSIPLTPQKFREIIYESDTIFDTHVAYQDGLTARFMWALGAEKKIITTNRAITKYPFYNKEQFYIIETETKHDNESLRVFLLEPFHMSGKERSLILEYRIDNWLKTILK